MAYGSYYGEFPAYVSVAERRKRAARKLAQLRKQGHEPAPIVLEPRGAIASTFWGKAWCENLETYADYASRLPAAGPMCATARSSTSRSRRARCARSSPGARSTT